MVDNGGVDDDDVDVEKPHNLDPRQTRARAKIMTRAREQQVVVRLVIVDDQDREKEYFASSASV